MKKLLILTLLWFTMLGAYAQADSSVAIPMKETAPPVKTDKPRKGNRMPAHQETCVVDFTTMNIRSTLSNEIISYELWDENGEYAVMVCIDDTDMVGFMCTLTGNYQLHLVTADTSYMGYIEL